MSRTHPPSPSPILLFAFRVLGWLVPCFALWYAIAPWLDRPAVWLAEAMVHLYDAGLVQAVELDGRIVNFVTTLKVQSPQGQPGVLIVEVNPLLSTYGSALFAALALAGRAGWRKLLVGLAVLVPFQAWGIAFDFIAQIVRSGQELVLQAGLQGWKAQLGALAYQLGSLIFPSLAPIACWIAMDERLRHALAAPSRSGEG